MGSIPGLGRSQGWEPTPMFLPRKNLHGQTNQAGCSPWGHKESDVTEQLSMHTYLQQNAKTWVLQNHIWVHSPECSKAKLLTRGRGKEKHDAYYRAPGKESGQLVLERPEHPDGVLKDRVRYVISLWTFFWLVGGEGESGVNIINSGSSWSGVYVLVGIIQLTFSAWLGVGVQYL